MANEVTTTRGGYLAANNDDYFARLAAEAQSLKGGGSDVMFMKFDGNSGDYSYGADSEPLEIGDELIWDPSTYQKGWVIWIDGEVEHEEMRGLGHPDGDVLKRDLPDLGPYGEDDGPVEQQTVEFTMTKEPFVRMKFQANNVSKRRALAALMKDFANTYKSHPGEIPIIALDEVEFQASTNGKKGGRKVTKHAPKFKIVDWMSIEEFEAKKADAAAARQDDDEGEDDAPRSRRSSRDEDDAPRSRRRAAEEDDAPRSRRSARDEDDNAEDERPARRSARDEADEDERPARRSAGRREESEDDDPPRRSARRDAEEGDDEDKPRRSRREEPEEDERPARRSRAAEKEDDADEERPAARRRSRF